MTYIRGLIVNVSSEGLHTLRHVQKGRHFADILKCIFMNEKWRLFPWLFPSLFLLFNLVHDCGNSIADALEFQQSCTKPLIRQAWLVNSVTSFWIHTTAPHVKSTCGDTTYLSCMWSMKHIRRFGIIIEAWIPALLKYQTYFCTYPPSGGWDLHRNCTTVKPLMYDAPNHTT